MTYLFDFCINTKQDMPQYKCKDCLHWWWWGTVISEVNNTDSLVMFNERPMNVTKTNRFSGQADYQPFEPLLMCHLCVPQGLCLQASFTILKTTGRWSSHGTVGRFWSSSTASASRACCVTAPLLWTG